ncbi:hypothetical protein G9P44_005550 [Scheffersomyces stipitis]|nr:hypothetical protein G9P44_005550 [Scheffersomyces stipitis]
MSSGVSFLSNLTDSVNGPSAVPAVNNSESWFVSRLLGGFVDAIVEQSEYSSNISKWNRFGGITSYCCSIYGLSCLVMAFVLNQTLVMASTNTMRNQQLAMNLNRRVMYNSKSADLLKKLTIISLRIAVISLLLYNCYNVLVTLNLLGHIGIPGNSLPWIYQVIPDRFFIYDPEFFCNNKYMKTPSTQVLIGPTSDMYWPIFLTFCLSSFTETFISSVQGKKPYTEGGLTIFEHSLAFQEFSSRGAFFFGSSKYHVRPTEQLLLSSLFSILNHLNIHIGGLINNNKYRLIPSSILGISFLGYFISALVNWKIMDFPAILIMTFIPQVLVLSIILISAVIFVTAIVANGFRLQDLNYASLFLYESREDSDISFQSLTFSLSDDFYTALLNVGGLAVTSAGKSSYITELSLVAVDNETWIERNLWEKIMLVAKAINKNPKTVNSNDVVSYLKENGLSGYGNLIDKPSQRLIAAVADEDFQNDLNSNKMSVFRRRYSSTKEIIVNFSDLFYSLFTDKIFFSFIPNLFRQYTLGEKLAVVQPPEFETAIEFGERKRSLPLFLRKFAKRRTASHENDMSVELDINILSDKTIDENYLQLLGGDPLPETDYSGDFNLNDYSNSDYESEAESIEVTSNANPGSGRSPMPVLETKEDDPINELISGEEFKELITSPNFTILHHHLNSESTGVMTRSRYHRLVKSSLTSGVAPEEQTNEDDGLKLLEIIINKRTSKPQENTADHDESFSDRFECVICQTNPREIIVWPCKCFAICESCRLTLVSKGIEGCVCCRREVEGVSKVFIP